LILDHYLLILLDEKSSAAHRHIATVYRQKPPLCLIHAIWL
jgi:hypothetical protein